MSDVKQVVDSEGNNWVVLAAQEYVDGKAGQELLDLSVKLLEKGVRHVGIDLGSSRVVNSVGISRLIEVVERYGQLEGAVAFCAANPTIKKTLRIMGLLTKAQVVDSVDALGSPTDSDA